MPLVYGKDAYRTFNVPQMFSGPANPLHTYDSNSGYNVGDEYFNTTSQAVYKCIGNAPGAAQWAAMTLAAPLMAMATQEMQPEVVAQEEVQEDGQPTRPTRGR